MNLPKASYFLVHRETGQRYPIMGNVTIGRATSDIVFASDKKLSTQHCLVQPSTDGVAVTDLRSANGMTIDGVKLIPERPYLLKDKSELCLGEQVFTLHTISLARKIRPRRSKRRRKSKSSAGDGYGLVYLALIAAVLWFAWSGKKYTDSPAPVQVSQSRLAEIYESYKALQSSVDRQTAPPQEVAKQIQSQVLSRLAALARQWAELQSEEGDSRRLLNAQLQFATALSGHAKTKMLYLKTGESRYLNELDHWNEQLEQASNDMRQATLTRPNTGFPTFMRSPLQIVEGELHQAIATYKRLGASVQNHEVSDSEMNESLRRDLIPKMTAVASRMGAISPQDDFERHKVALEQKLLTAFLGQLKAMSAYADVKDPAHAQELEHWTAEVEKVNAELKLQGGPVRMPATQAP